MTSTWIGGRDNRANDPNDWSPTGVPLNTDAVTSHGTINIEGLTLAPIADFKLIVEGDALINLIRSNHPQAAPNVRPIDVRAALQPSALRTSLPLLTFRQTVLL